VSTAKEAKRAIILGLDGGHPELIQKFVKEGKLPNFERMLKEGVFKEALEPFPTITPPNWTTIGTGAWPGTHGITDFFLPNREDEPLDKINFGFNTRESSAEYVWQAAERAGKKPILIKWEVSWPPNHNGIQIEGCGPGLVNLHELGPVRLHTLEPLPMTSQVSLQPAGGEWKGLQPSWETLEGKISMFLHGGGEKVYDIAVIKSGRAGYDKVLVCKDKDAAQPVAEVKPGQWSDWVLDEFELVPDEERVKARTADMARLKKYRQKERHDYQASTTAAAKAEGLALYQPKPVEKGTFRFKLINLAADAGELELISTQIWPIVGYTQPLELGEELYEKIGPFFTNPARDALHYGWMDEGTFFELMDYQHQWLTKASKYLATTKEWDLLFVETHCTDYLSHFYLNYYQPECGASLSEQRNATTWLTRHYQSIDRMLGELLTLADEDTLFLIVSDHSGTGCPQPQVDARKVLEQAGLLVYKVDDEGNRGIDWSKTRAYPQRTVHVYVNLKGRDRDGIVEPEDYEATVEAIIQAMTGYKDPATGMHTFSAVLRKNDAAILGLWGDRVGDVVYARRPEFDLEHGSQLPTARLGDLTIRSIFFMKGPNVKKGLHLQRHLQMTAVAPTLAYLMGFPIPAQAEGPVVWEALEDPDFRLNQVRELEAEVARLKAKCGE